MVQFIKYVKEAYINEGRGGIDFLTALNVVKPDVFVVNAERDGDDKLQLCAERGMNTWSISTKQR